LKRQNPLLERVLSFFDVFGHVLEKKYGGLPTNGKR
jgi:hypothetical protein